MLAKCQTYFSSLLLAHAVLAATAYNNTLTTPTANSTQAPPTTNSTLAPPTSNSTEPPLVANSTQPHQTNPQGCDLAGGWYGNINFGACYYLGNLTGNYQLPYLDWFGARSYCASLRPDSFLARVRTQYQNDLIRFQIGSLDGVYLWLAANDLTFEGAWEWDLGTGDMLSYTHWSTLSQQPDNLGGNEDCVVLYGDDESRWYDVDCTGLFQPLCEYTP